VVTALSEAKTRAVAGELGSPMNRRTTVARFLRRALWRGVWQAASPEVEHPSDIHSTDIASGD